MNILNIHLTHRKKNLHILCTNSLPGGINGHSFIVEPGKGSPSLISTSILNSFPVSVDALLSSEI